MLVDVPGRPVNRKKRMEEEEGTNELKLIDRHQAANNKLKGRGGQQNWGTPTSLVERTFGGGPWEKMDYWSKSKKKQRVEWGRQR